MLPSRKLLASTLLDRAYSKAHDDMMSSLKGREVCLTSDGTTNVNGMAIINYVVSCLGKSFFWEAVQTKQESHTGEWLAADLSRVIRSHDAVKVVGVVTDNTSANKAAWGALTKNFPELFVYGIFFFQNFD